LIFLKAQTDAHAIIAPKGSIMRQLDWAIIAWSVWTALLIIAVLYLLFYP